MQISRIASGLIAVALAVTPLNGQSSTVRFSFPDRGGVSLTTGGTSPALQVGYAQISDTLAVSAGFAVYGLRQGGALVSEVTIPAAIPLQGGRIYVETVGAVNTGVAIANPNDEPITLAGYFTDSTGIQTKTTVFTIPANQQIARFLTESPFNIGTGFRGTFTFTTLTQRPDLGVASLALRSFVNERGEFLMTTLPVIPFDQEGLLTSGTLPHFATGGGWSTEVVLVNPTDSELAGTITFLNRSGGRLIIESDRGSSAAFDYRVAARSSWRLQTSRNGSTQTGSVKVQPSVPGLEIPVGFLIFSFESNGAIVTSAGVSSPPSASNSRIFVESSGQFFSGAAGSMNAGIAISNADSDTPANVTLELTTLDGRPTGMRGTLTIPARGQDARFLSEVPGFASLPVSFQAVLRISASVPVTVIGLRARYNERREFLVTTSPVVNEDDFYFNAVLRYSDFVFPHFVDGAGYTTQFVLFSGWTPGAASGELDFLSNTGTPLPLSLQMR